MTVDRHAEVLGESVCLRRTEKARAELLAARRDLGRRERGLLFLCDGSRSLAAIRPVAGEDVVGMVCALIKAGYLEAIPARATSVAIAAVSADPTSAAAVHPGQGQAHHSIRTQTGVGTPFNSCRIAHVPLQSAGDHAGPQCSCSGRSTARAPARSQGRRGDAALCAGIRS